MLAFIVPVKSEAVTLNWPIFSGLVNRTLSSICNQTNPNFKVFVACHEIPETDFKNDPRVEFLTVDFPPPAKDAEYVLKEADKAKKLILAASQAQTAGYPYVMTVDSDDCISNKICDFVCKNTKEENAGWYVKKGYLYPEGKKYTYLNLKNFNTLCGSGVIFKPEFLEYMIDENLYFHHERTKLSNGQSLKPLPFPGALYSMLNGDNIVLNRTGMKEKRTRFNPFNLDTMRTLFRRLGKYSIVRVSSIKEEFAI